MSWKSENDKKHQPHTHIWVKTKRGRDHLNRPLFAWVCRCGETGHPIR